MHVDLAIACVWPEQNTPQYILVHDKHIQIHVVDFKNKNSKGWLQIQQTSNSWIRIEENPNCWIQSQQTQISEFKIWKNPQIADFNPTNLNIWIQSQKLKLLISFNPTNPIFSIQSGIPQIAHFNPKTPNRQFQSKKPK